MSIFIKFSAFLLLVLNPSDNLCKVQSFVCAHRKPTTSRRSRNTGDPSFSSPRDGYLDSTCVNAHVLMQGNGLAATKKAEHVPSSGGINNDDAKENQKQNAWANYHLVWSPGFLKKTATGSVGLFALQLLQTNTNALNMLSWSSPFVASAVQNVILPLFASSCCALQLLINVVAGGCAGFNTYLGPIRPYMVALLFFLSLQTPYKGWKSVGRLFVRWTIAFLPELVHLWTEKVLWKPRGHNVMPIEAYPVQMMVELDVPTMGCVACIQSIDSALSALRSDQARVIQARSQLKPLGAKGGTVQVQLAAVSSDAATKLADRLVDAVAAVGFEGGTVTSMRAESSTQCTT